MCSYFSFLFFFFNDTATTEIYTLSLHDALPIYLNDAGLNVVGISPDLPAKLAKFRDAHELTFPLLSDPDRKRSEEHTSELQSRQYLVCRLLLEKKKKKKIRLHHTRNNECKALVT